jgi:hypothetical protein
MASPNFGGIARLPHILPIERKAGALSERHSDINSATACPVKCGLVLLDSPVLGRSILMSFQYRVLCFGHDLMLLEKRQWLLEERFLSVHVSSLSDLERLAEGGGFDLLILCDSLSQHDFRKATHLALNLRPRLKLLALSFNTAAWEHLPSGKALLGSDGGLVLLERPGEPLYLN